MMLLIGSFNIYNIHILFVISYPNPFSILEQREKKRHDDMLRQFEIERQQQQVFDENKMYSKRKRDAKISKLDNESEYHQFLTRQLKEKQEKLKSEKEADLNFLHAEKIKLEKEDRERKKFFEKLKNIQKTNDLKNKMLEKYMAQDVAILNSRKDEQAYIKHISEEEKRAAEKAMKEQLIKDKRKHDNSAMLDMQLKEKEIEREHKKRQEEIIAKMLSEEVSRERGVEQERVKQQQERKKEYFRSLSEQINFNKKKKSYSMLMTEHERKVNDNDIQAYQN